MNTGSGAHRRTVSGTYGYQEWAGDALGRHQEPAAGYSQYEHYERHEDIPQHEPDRSGFSGHWGPEDAEQGLDNMSQHGVDDSAYGLDDVPSRFDIGGYGTGLFGGPGADLFGAHDVTDHVPEQNQFGSGPIPAIRDEPPPDFSGSHRAVPGDPLGVEPAEESGSLVRPYTRTGGRTRPDYDLAIEALVSTSERGMERDAAVLPEHRSICGLCVDTRSVAEVAAHLRLPLGVVRVLIGDMASMGLVLIHQGGLVVGDRPSIEFLERVLSGLRRL